MGEPVFSMPACWRHFLSGHRWWCKACDLEVERQFKDLAEAWWASRASKVCPTCDGEGVVPVWSGMALGDCTACKGTGKPSPAASVEVSPDAR